MTQKKIRLKAIRALRYTGLNLPIRAKLAKAFLRECKEKNCHIFEFMATHHWPKYITTEMMNGHPYLISGRYKLIGPKGSVILDPIEGKIISLRKSILNV